MSDITFEYVTEPGDSIAFEVTGMVTLPPGGGGGTSDHRDLTNRSSADQHPTSAITGLDAALAGKETAGAAATAQAYAVQRANHTGTQSADSLTDGTTNKAYTAAEQSKLAAITGTNTGDQDLSALAPKASPTFTGTPAAPTATAGTSTTQVATTAFVDRLAIARRKTGVYYVTGASGGNLTPVKDTMYLVPWATTSPLTLVRIGFHLAVIGGSAGAVARLGIYATDSGGQPTGSPLVDAGTLPTDTSAVGKELTISLAVGPGLYALAYVWQTSAVNGGIVFGSSGAGTYYGSCIGSSTLNLGTSVFPAAAWTQTGVTGALPTISLTSTATDAPRMTVRG